MTCFPRVLAFLPHSKWVVPPWGCYLSNFATLLFTTFEISKHPTFPECLIWKVLEPPNYNSKRLNYTTVEWFDPLVGLLFTTFGSLTSYYIWNTQASKWGAIFEIFGTSQCKFAVVKFTAGICFCLRRAYILPPD